MSWARLDDRYYCNPKVRKAWHANPAAVGLHVMAISYCALHGTDGYVAHEWVVEQLPAHQTRGKVLACLLDAGLIERARSEQGFVIHDFLDYNPTGQESSMRTADISLKRREAGKKGAEARWQTDSKPMANPVAIANGKNSSRPDPSLTSKAPPNPPQAGGNRKRDREVFMHDLIEWAASVGVTEIPNRIEAPGTNLLKAYNTAQPWQASDPAAAFKEAAGRYYSRALVIQ